MPHLIRNTFRLASRSDWDRMAKDLRRVYTAANETDARARLDDFAEIWGHKYPAIRGLWEAAWAEFIPFLDYSPEIRRVMYSTNAMESLKARMRRATRARGHFQTEQAALNCPYLTIRSLDPTGKGSRPLDEPLEARSQRLRHHLRRPPLHRHPPTPPTPPTPVTPLS
jgi:putative transposase